MLDLHIGTPMRKGLGVYNDKYIPAVNNKGDYMTDGRITRIKVEREYTRLKKELNRILSDNTVIKSIKEDCFRIKNLTPSHMAALIIGSRSYIKVWVKCFIEEIIPTLTQAERDHLILKILLSTKGCLDKTEFNKLIKIMVAELNPKTGVLLFYYFPEVLSKSHHKVIEEYLSKYETDIEGIEGVVNMFNKRNQFYFKYLKDLLDNR